MYMYVDIYIYIFVYVYIYICIHICIYGIRHRAVGTCCVLRSVGEAPVL